MRAFQTDNGGLRVALGGRGPLIIFNHALGPLAWGDLSRLEADFTVAIPDWVASDYDHAARAALDWFGVLCSELGVTQAALCVWSMAGPAGIRFAARQPDNLSHLVLVDVAGLSDALPPLEWKDVPHLVMSRLRGYPTRGMVRAMWRSWVLPGLQTSELEEATYQFFRGQRKQRPGPQGTEEPPLLDALSLISVPVLVLGGRHSAVLGPVLARSVSGHLDRADVVIFERSSHALQLEEPEKFQQVMASWLDRVTTDAPRR
ncbi:MAG: alpha/beta hydrolase [Saprospiraceae bacterium]|nr:alpha/beta hydrolase [Saprospiraceae bacterium]